MTDREMLDILRSKKLCCAQMMVAMGLCLKGEQNDGLVDAAFGLCLGVHSGLLCGTLSGGALMLSLFDKELAKNELIPMFSQWFEDEMTSKYGSLNCGEIIGGDPSFKTVRCPQIVELAYFEAKRLLLESGQI